MDRKAESRGLHTQEAKSEKEVGPGDKTSKSAPSDPLPLVRLHLLKVPKQSHQPGTKPREPCGGHFIFKHTVPLKTEPQHSLF